MSCYWVAVSSSVYAGTLDARSELPNVEPRVLPSMHGSDTE